MKVSKTDLDGVCLITPRVFGDERGYFFESYSTRSFGAVADVTFVQDNISFSCRGTLRGLHLQHPTAQGKLVTAITGEIYDVAVDVRVGSATFGRYTAHVLSQENKTQLYVPPGFAHGFCVLSETATVHYKCTALYEPSEEQGVRFDDPDLKIPWPVKSPLLSPKDRAAPRLADISRDRLPKFLEAE